ncbi:hypothetical protein HPP92_026853, partial [Vanilla planifolia]
MEDANVFLHLERLRSLIELEVKEICTVFLDNLLSQRPDQQQTLLQLEADQPFRFPSSFTFVMRAFSTLEGFTRHPTESGGGVEFVNEIRRQADD